MGTGHFEFYCDSNIRHTSEHDIQLTTVSCLPRPQSPHQVVNSSERVSISLPWDTHTQASFTKSVDYSTQL